LKLDIRRLWKCPVCGRSVKTEGTVIAKRCSCRKEGAWMRLMEENRPVPVHRSTAADTDESAAAGENSPNDNTTRDQQDHESDE